MKKLEAKENILFQVKQRQNVVFKRVNKHSCMLDAKIHLMVFFAISQVFSGTGSLVTLYEDDLLPLTVP